MRKTSMLFALILAMLMIFNLTGCAPAPVEKPAESSAAASQSASASQAAPEETGEEILIACSMPLSGSMAESGVGAKEGIEYAVARWNEKGGVKLSDGKMHKVKLLVEDDGGKPEEAVANFEKFINQDKAKILYGIVLSGSGLAAMELCKKYPVFMSTVRCVSSEIPAKVKADPEGFKRFFKPEYNSTDSGEQIAEALNSMGTAGNFTWTNKTVAYLTEDNDYGRSTQKGVEDALAKFGAKTVAYEIVPEGHVDFYSQLNKIKQANPEVVVTNLLPVSSGVAYCKQYKEVGMKALNFGIGFPEETGFFEQTGGTAEGLLWTIMRSDFENNPKHKAFAEEFKQLFPNSVANYDQLHTNDTTNMLLQAIEKAGEMDVDKISEAYLNSDYQGNIGRIVLNKDDHSLISGPEYYPHSVAQIQDGKNVVVFPDSMASSKFKPQQ